MNNILLKANLVATFITLLLGCTKIDETYKKFLKDSDIIYPGRVDSVKVFTGNERIKFNVLLSSDPKIKKIKVFWNSKLDSIEFPVTSSEIGTRKDLLLPSVKEGSHTFYIYTYNQGGRASIVTEVFSKVYGSEYQKMLKNRGIVDASHFSGSTVKINWAFSNPSHGDTKAKIKYEDIAGIIKQTEVNKDASVTTLEDYKLGKPFFYETFIRPDTTSMDWFSAGEISQSVFSYFDEQKASLWNIKSVSSEDATQKARFCTDNYIIEDNKKSYWSTNSSANYPHYLIIDMGATTAIDGLYCVQRTVSYSAQLKDVEVQTNTTGQDKQPWTTIATGILNRNPGRQNLWLNNRTSLRYVKIIFNSDWTNSKQLSLMEIGTLQRW